MMYAFTYILGELTKKILLRKKDAFTFTFIFIFTSI